MRNLLAFALASAVFPNPAFGQSATLSPGHPAGLKNASSETGEAPLLIGFSVAGLAGVLIFVITDTGGGASATTSTAP
jgi:hypothetical protein